MPTATLPNPVHTITLDPSEPAFDGRLTRRSLLAALSALAVGAATGCSARGGGDQQDFGGLGGSLRSGSGAGPTGGGAFRPQAPFALNVGCELSEDYFPVQNHAINPKKDRVVAYSRADGEVEAIVLQDGVVKQVYRDASQPGGWNVNPLPDANGVTAMVAGISAPSGTPPRLKVCYVKSSGPTTRLFIAVENPSDPGQTPPSFTTTSIDWTSLAVDLQLTTSWDGGVLVSAMHPINVGTGGKTMGSLYFYFDGLTKDAHADHLSVAESSGNLTGFTWNGGGSDFGYVGGAGAGWSAVVANPAFGTGFPTLLLCLPLNQCAATGNALIPQVKSINIWDWTVVPGQTTGTKLSNWSVDVSMPSECPTKPEQYSIEGISTLGSRRQPVMLVRTLAQREESQALWLLSPDDDAPHRPWTWTPLGLPDDLDAGDPVVLSTGIRPGTSDEKRDDVDATSCLDVFVLARNTLSVFRQAPQGDAAKDYSHPLYYPVIPLQPDVALMTSQAARSTGDELVLVGTDGFLHSLLKDPVTNHWTGSPVHLPASDLQQVSAYRTELSLVDSWGTPVTDQPLQVSASTPVTALLDGRTVNLGTEPVALDTDGQGQAVVSILADGLSAPTLTIDSKNLAQATVNPAAAVNGYLKGGTTLNYQPSLDADQLGRAKTPEGRLVAPKAAASGPAKDAFSTLSAAATCAAAPTLTGARSSHTLQRRDGETRATTGHGRSMGTTGVIDDIDRWAHDALHAIKTGVVAAEQISFVGNTFTLGADFAAWAGKAVTVVVHGVEDAAHVFHAVLNKIGGAILDAIRWLEAEALSLLKGSLRLAQQYEDWLHDCLEQLHTVFVSDQSAVHRWLDQQRIGFKNQLTDLEKRFSSSSTTLGGLGGGGNLQGSRRAAGGGSLLGAPADQSGHPHTNWLFAKVKNELTGSLTFASDDAIRGQTDAVGGAVSAAAADFRAAFSGVWSFFAGVVKDPKDIPTVGVGTLVGVLADLVDAVFTLIEGVIDTGMILAASLVGTIKSILDTSLTDALGLVGKLLALAGLEHVTVGKVVTLLFAFPTVLMYKVTHRGEGAPFGLTGTVGRGATDVGAADAADDLQLCAGVALGVWAAIDAVAAAITASSAGSDEAEGPALFTAIDIVAPVVVSVLTVPATRGGQPFRTPPVGPDDTSKLDFASWLAGLLPAFFVASDLYIDTHLKGNGPAAVWQEHLPFTTSAAGMFSLFTGCTATLDDWSAAECAIAVLNNVPLVVAPCLTTELVESTEGGSAAVACALTLTCGWIGATLYGFYG